MSRKQEEQGHKVRGKRRKQGDERRRRGNEDGLFCPKLLINNCIDDNSTI